MVKIRSRTNTLQHAGMGSVGYGGVLLYPQEYQGEGEPKGDKKRYILPCIVASPDFIISQEQVIL